MNAWTRWGLALVIAAGLAIDAFTHLDLAHNYAFNSTGSVNEGVLFQIEGISAIVVAALVLLRPNLWTGLLAVALSGGGAAVLLIYRYVNVGKLGPLPNMYEPIWFHEKTESLIGELVAFAASLVLVAGCWYASRQSRVSGRTVGGHGAMSARAKSA